MDASFGYRYNPSYTPQPHFIPGYGGHLSRALNKFGTTYSNASHEILREHPEIAARLAPLERNRRTTQTFDYAHICPPNEEKQSVKINESDEAMFMPEHVCPRYTGCLTLKKKGVPLNDCCGDFLTQLGCFQDPYDIPGERREDAIPGPPPYKDFLKAKRRCEHGMYKKYMQ